MITVVAEAFCTACTQLGCQLGDPSPHETLLYQGIKPNEATGGYEQRFRCSTCGTQWVRLVDKWGVRGSFLLMPKCR